MSAAPAIHAEALSKWFGEVIALNHMTVNIGWGVTGLLGPNGAGKSTFLKLLLGLHGPSRGRIAVLGETPRNNLGVLRRLAYCPETDHFFDGMTGLDFVYWLNRQWGMDAAAARRRAEAACERVGMAERMRGRISRYSKGMRQRIKIAQALALPADVLVFDEPMSGLDPQGREEMSALLRGLGDDGKAVIISSHILHEIERVTDSVVLLHQGSLLAEGRVREIRDLIDRRPHTIAVECGDARTWMARIAQEPGVLELSLQDSGFTVRTAEPNGCYERLNRMAADEGAPITGIRCADDNLQAVFDYLVGR